MLKYELSSEELVTLGNNMEEQGRKVKVLSLEEALKLGRFEIRPSSMEVLKRMGESLMSN